MTALARFLTGGTKLERTAKGHFTSRSAAVIGRIFGPAGGRGRAKKLSKAALKAIGSKGWKARKVTPERQREISRMGAAAANKVITKETRQRIGRLGGLARVKAGHKIDPLVNIKGAAITNLRRWGYVDILLEA